MWATPSISRQAVLLSLTVLMLVSVSQVESYVPVIGLSCCSNVSTRKMVRIKECYEQKPREGCDLHAFIIKNKRGKQKCIDPDSLWLKDKIQKGVLDCLPVLSLSNQVLEGGT
ncbi:eotaxin-like [Pholidichthys leucotaenia]